MPFKTLSQSSDAPESPDRLFLELTRRRFPDVLPHQREVMRAYSAKWSSRPDVALQLPTGSGKTLVGLLIAEWRRRKHNERVVYLCPTTQLVHQVVEQADRNFGLNVVAFVGSAAQYTPEAKAAYTTGSRVAITTYSSLFNSNPYFSQAETLILDDAHAAENYVASLWSVLIEKAKHPLLFSTLSGVLKQVLDPVEYVRLMESAPNSASASWVDKLPTPRLRECRNQLIEIMDQHAADAKLDYQWKMIRSGLDACHLYISPKEILVRPLIPPTWAHESFTRPVHRLYMSATLGSGGELERLFGRKRIERVPIPEGWDSQGVGRRFFIFPSMSLKESDAARLSLNLMKRAGRSVVLVPSERRATLITQEVETELAYRVFTAKHIESSKSEFVSEANAVAVLANRYDGIDFPGDACRLLFVEGFPRAMNLQERFLMSRMGAILLFNERIQTRVMQAIGRCTRSLEDYSAVIIDGEELPDYLGDLRRRRYLHPELQAELQFGIEQSMNTSSADILDNFSTFLDNGEEWDQANQQIVQHRGKAKQHEFPEMEQLAKIVEHEVTFCEKMWQGDFVSAVAAAHSILGQLTAPELRGYRAWWYYASGSAAWLELKTGSVEFESKAKDAFEAAKSAAPLVPWLVCLTRSRTTATSAPDDSLLEQIERLERYLEKSGTLHDRQYAETEKTIAKGMESNESVEFETAQVKLGELLGFISGKVENEGSPDPWWLAGREGFVFEDYTQVGDSPLISVNKARQAASHVNWMLANVPEARELSLLAVLVTATDRTRTAAAPHLKNVAIWKLESYRQWAHNALSIIRSLRSTFSEPGNLIWRATAAEKFRENRLDGHSLGVLFNDRKGKFTLTD